MVYMVLFSMSDVCVKSKVYIYVKLEHIFLNTGICLISIYFSLI